MAWQTCFLNICSSHLPINYLPPLEVPDPYLLFLISGWQISLKNLSESWIPLDTYLRTKLIFSSINLSYVSLISRSIKNKQTNKLEGSKQKLFLLSKTRVSFWGCKLDQIPWDQILWYKWFTCSMVNFIHVSTENKTNGPISR